MSIHSDKVDDTNGYTGGCDSVKLNILFNKEYLPC